ncbi:MAG: TonB-dependent receptor [Pseudomonadota bacterium]
MAFKTDIARVALIGLCTAFVIGVGAETAMAQSKPIASASQAPEAPVMVFDGLRSLADPVAANFGREVARATNEQNGKLPHGPVIDRTAQSSEEAGSEVAESALPPIVVTARRTEELLEDVPGSIKVLDDQELERSNIRDTDDVIRRTPNVSFTEGATPGDLNLSIRGISNLIGVGASGPTNGVFVDGVLVNPTGVALGISPNLLDLERTEVALGPQGTAFGRGTIGGAINFVPKKPTDEVEVEFSGEVGSFPDAQGRLILNSPILEDGLLSARLVTFLNASDGFIEQPLIGSSVRRDDQSARLSLRSQPTDRLLFDVSASYDRSGFDAGSTIPLDNLESEDLISLSNEDGESSIERVLVTGTGVYDFDIGSLRSTTSFFFVDSEAEGDGDGLPLSFTFSSFDTQESAIAQEFRFESEAFELPGNYGEVSFNIGSSFSFNSFETESLLDPGEDAFELLTGVFFPMAPPGFVVPDDGSTIGSFTDVSIFNFGVFGDVRWKPFEKLELVGGARFNRDRVETSGETITTGASALVIPSSPFFEAEETFSAITPNASIKYDWTDDFSTYFSFSTGFRAGGISGTFEGPLPFDEERVRSFEAGFRASLLDDRLRLNASGFLLDYDDIQVFISQVVDGVPEFVTENAASARSVGTEIGVVALPVEGLVIDSQLGLNFAKFTDFADSPFGDLTDTRLPNAPVTTYSIVGDYQHPQDILPGVQGFVRSEYTFTSEFANLLDPNLITFDSFDVLNFRLGLRAENFEVEAFVENALNEIYATGSTSLVAAGVLGADVNVDIGEPRRFGFRATMRF